MNLSISVLYIHFHIQMFLRHEDIFRESIHSRSVNYVIPVCRRLKSLFQKYMQYFLLVTSFPPSWLPCSEVWRLTSSPSSSWCSYVWRPGQKDSHQIIWIFVCFQRSVKVVLTVLPPARTPETSWQQSSASAPRRERRLEGSCRTGPSCRQIRKTRPNAYYTRQKRPCHSYIEEA